MRKILVCQVEPQVLSKLANALEEYGWITDSCQGLLEMLRLIEKNEYEFVLLNASPRNVEVCTRLEAIKALGKNPKIVLNFSSSEEIVPSHLPLTQFPMIKGVVTIEKLLTAVQKPS